MAWDNRLALCESESFQVRQLDLDVLLVLKDERLARQHGLNGCVRWADVNNGEVATSFQESSCFV